MCYKIVDNTRLIYQFVKSEADLWHRKISKEKRAMLENELKFCASSFDNFIGLYKCPLWSQYGHRISFVCGIVFYDIDRLKTNKYHDQNLIRVTRSWNFPLGKLKISAPAVYRLMDTGKYSNFQAVRRGSYKQFIKRKINRNGARARSRSSRTLLFARWKTRWGRQKEGQVRGRRDIFSYRWRGSTKHLCDVNTSYVVYRWRGTLLAPGPVGPTYRSQSRTGSTGVRRMINDIPTPAVGPVQRSDTELSKACITRDRQLSSVSDRLRRIKRNIGDRYAVTPMLD